MWVLGKEAKTQVIKLALEERIGRFGRRVPLKEADYVESHALRLKLSRWILDAVPLFYGAQHQAYA